MNTALSWKPQLKKFTFTSLHFDFPVTAGAALKSFKSSLGVAVKTCNLAGGRNKYCFCRQKIRSKKWLRFCKIKGKGFLII